MAIAFRSISATSYASRSNTTVTAPSGITDDDILIASITLLQSGSAPSAPTPPSGFTLVSTSPSLPTEGTSSGYYLVHYVYWKRASSESGDYAFTHSTATTQGVVGCYSGCIASGTPVDAASANEGFNTADNVGTTFSGITTSVADTKLLAIQWDWYSDSSNRTPPSGFTEREDGTILHWSDKDQASSGATGNFTQNNGGFIFEPWGSVLLALLPGTSAPDVDQSDFQFFDDDGGLPGYSYGTTPVIEAADVTSSGNNTASAPSVTYPAYSSGDLLIQFVAVDQQRTITLPSAGPNSETINTICNTSGAGANGPALACIYWVATAGQSSGDTTWSLDTNDSWDAQTIRVPSGEFDATKPIDVISSVGSSNTDSTTADMPAFTADRASGRIVVVGGVDADPMDATFSPTGWTDLYDNDRGAICSFSATRDSATSAAESVASAAFGINPTDSYAVVGFVVNAPRSQTGATATAAANTNPELDVDTTYRWHVRVENTGSATTQATWKVQYKHIEGTNTWTDVSSSSSVIRATLSSNFANGDDVGEFLGGSGTYVTNNNAALESSGSATLAAVLGASAAFELHLAFQVRSADVDDADTIQLRIVESDGTALDSYTNTPTITANEEAAFTTGTGAASGTGAAAAVGASTVDSDGVAAGTGAAAATGASTADSDGASAGTGTATGVGNAIFEGVGAASGTGAASGDGLGVNTADGAADGTGDAAAVGASTADSDGSADGTGTATGVGSATVDADGASTGTGTATAVGAATFDADGVADGTGDASGVGQGVNAADGSSDGTGAATAVGAATADSDGASAGTGTATGVGEATAASDGAADGTGTATGVGASTAAADGAAAGVGDAIGIADAGISNGAASGEGTATGIGAATAAGDGAASGTGTAAAVGEATTNADGAASGTGTATGVGASTADADGAASGTGTATGDGEALTSGNGVGEASGTGEATGVGASTAAATGSADGTGTATGVAYEDEVVTPPQTGTGGGGSIRAGSGRYVKIGEEVERVELVARAIVLRITTTSGTVSQPEIIEPAVLAGQGATLRLVAGTATIGIDDTAEVVDLVKRIRQIQSEPKKSKLELRLEALERQMKAFLKGTGS